MTALYVHPELDIETTLEHVSLFPDDQDPNKIHLEVEGQPELKLVGSALYNYVAGLKGKDVDRNTLESAKNLRDKVTDDLVDTADGILSPNRVYSYEVRAKDVVHNVLKMAVEQQRERRKMDQEEQPMSTAHLNYEHLFAPVNERKPRYPKTQ